MQIAHPADVGIQPFRWSEGATAGLTVLQAVQNQTLPTGPKPMDLYSQLVFTVGNATAQAKARLDASDVSLQQLNDQRGAISGVSIDEETTNLIRFQHAYQASARVISVVDELTRTMIEHVEPVGRKLCELILIPPRHSFRHLADPVQAQTAMEQLSTGKRVNRPSDDPAASATEVQNQAQEDRIDQYLQSVSSLRSQFQTADSTLSSMVTSLNRAVTLGVEAGNSSLSPQNLQSIGQEAQGVLDQLVQLANTTFHGSYIFAGTDTSQPPFTQAGGAITYQGNNGINQVAIADGRTLQSNVPGNQLFQASGGDVLGSVQQLVTAIQRGNRH